jgi:DNA-binding transcriptional LysR family regulator
MRITLHKLDVFEHVVELGGVTRAAEQLFVAQPVVTAHVRSLEERLGVRLFYREGRQMHLTEAGRAVHVWASDMLRRTRELERHLETLADGTRGTVVLGASMSVGGYLLPPALSAFVRERPLIDIRLNIHDSEHAVADTLAGDNDFAVIMSEPDPTDALTTELIGAEVLTFVCAPGFDIPDHVTIDQLEGIPFVDAPRGLIRRTWVDREMHRVGLRDRTIAIELGHAEAMKQATRAGLGIAVLSKGSVADELMRGELREITVDGVNLDAPVYLVYRRDKLFTTAHTDLIEVIRELFRTLPSGGAAHKQSEDERTEAA